MERKDHYEDVHTLCDLIDDLCETAHKEGINVQDLRRAEKLVWNWFAARRCPNLLYQNTEELVNENGRGF